MSRTSWPQASTGVWGRAVGSSSHVESFDALDSHLPLAFALTLAFMYPGPSRPGSSPWAPATPVQALVGEPSPRPAPSLPPGSPNRADTDRPRGTRATDQRGHATLRIQNRPTPSTSSSPTMSTTKRPTRESLATGGVGPRGASAVVARTRARLSLALIAQIREVEQ